VEAGAILVVEAGVLVVGVVEVGEQLAGGSGGDH
jgi:hypothetical protein